MSETQAVQEVAAAAGINKPALLVGGVVLGLTTTAMGYYTAKRRLEAKYAKMAEDEIESIKDLYMSKVRQSASTRIIDEPSIGRVTQDLGYAPPTMESEMKDMHHDHDGDDFLTARAKIEEAAEPEIVANVFQDDDVWEWGAEKHMREAGADPYVLHKDEWLSESGAYIRSSLTYFEGDDVLADEHDTPVDDQEMLVGLVNLQKFGHGSGDPNVVYIRNVELQMELEIVRSEGKFSEQTRGMIDSPADQSDPRKRRNRGPH